MDEPATTADKTGLNFFALFSFKNYYNKNSSRYFQQVGVYGNYYESAASVDFIPEQFVGEVRFSKQRFSNSDVKR